MTLRPSTMTFDNLQAYVKRTFGDESGVQLENADIVRWANEGIRNIAVINRLLRTKSTSAAVIGQWEYTFPDSSIQQVHSVHINGSPIIAVDFAQAEENFLSGDPDHTEAGTPLFWWNWGDTFTLWPKPTAADTITLFFTRNPILVTGLPGDVLDVPDKHYQTLVDFVLWKCYEMDEDWQAAQVKEAQYRAALMEQKDDEMQAQDLTFPVVREVW